MKKKKRRNKLVKLKRRAPMNPAGFGGAVGAGWGIYTIEGNLPTFRDFFNSAS